MNLTYAEGAALVAGGSGGIGSAVVRRLARSGVDTALTFRSGAEAAKRLVEEHVDAARVAAFGWSSAGFEEAAALIRQVESELGPVRLLVFASGVAQEAALHTLSEDAAQELIRTNLAAAVALTRAAVVRMMKRGSGRVVLVGSVSGSRGIRGHTVYAATKAGLEGFTRALAQEAGSFGVTVNCVAPGAVDTPMIAEMPARQRDRWLGRIPLGRAGEPEEIADAVAFLLSDQAAYITGQTLRVDGGLSL